MGGCSITVTEASKNWPEGIISVKLTMNPYILSLAEEASAKQGMKLWEYINVALWEKLGKPAQDVLLNYAAEQEIDEEDAKWKKRLKLTARHELEVLAHRQTVNCAERCGVEDQGRKD